MTAEELAHAILTKAGDLQMAGLDFRLPTEQPDAGFADMLRLPDHRTWTDDEVKRRLAGISNAGQLNRFVQDHVYEVLVVRSQSSEARLPMQATSQEHSGANGGHPSGGPRSGSPYLPPGYVHSQAPQSPPQDGPGPLEQPAKKPRRSLFKRLRDKLFGSREQHNQPVPRAWQSEPAAGPLPQALHGQHPGATMPQRHAPGGAPQPLNYDQVMRANSGKFRSFKQLQAAINRTAGPGGPR